MTSDELLAALNALAHHGMTFRIRTVRSGWSTIKEADTPRERVECFGLTLQESLEAALRTHDLAPPKHQGHVLLVPSAESARPTEGA